MAAPHAHRSKVAALLSRIIAGITADVLQLAARLQGSERLLRREVEEYRKDPSAGASKGLCSVKVWWPAQYSSLHVARTIQAHCAVVAFMLQVLHSK